MTPLRSAAVLAAGLCAWLAMLAALRYGVMESGTVARPGVDAMALERLRACIGLAIYWRVPGCAALALALAALPAPPAMRRPLALCGLFAGLAALMLYNADPGAIAVVIALFRLAAPVRYRAPA